MVGLPLHWLLFHYLTLCHIFSPSWLPIMQHELGVYGNFFYTSSNAQNAMLKSDRNTPNLCCIMGNHDELKGFHLTLVEPTSVKLAQVGLVSLRWILQGWGGLKWSGWDRPGEGRFHEIIIQNEIVSVLFFLLLQIHFYFIIQKKKSRVVQTFVPFIGTPNCLECVVTKLAQVQWLICSLFSGVHFDVPLVVYSTGVLPHKIWRARSNSGAF